MAKIGRPILLRGNSINSAGEKIRPYRDTMDLAGFDEEAGEKNLDQIWVWREMHLAETDDQALGEFLPAHHQAYAKMEEVRQQWNPNDHPCLFRGCRWTDLATAILQTQMPGKT